MSLTKTTWTRVTRSKPCPICGKPDYCGVSSDGQAAICMRVTSDKTAKNGGYIHKLGGPVVGQWVEREPVEEVAKLTPYEVSEIIDDCISGTTLAQVEEHAASLGVSSESLQRLGACWSRNYLAWAWPMSDAQGRDIGIRLRTVSGKKWTVKGSCEGLFVPSGLDRVETLFIVEGPTDTAAMLTLGFDCIGRPSCMSGVDKIKEFIRRRNIRRVVIVSDRDEPKTRPDGSIWFPGQEGAQKLAEALRPVVTSLKVIFPQAHKDARKWLQAGATKAVVDCVVRYALEWEKQ